MQTIYKYPCMLNVSVPKGAVILSVGYQPMSGIVFWALVDLSKSVVKRSVVAYPTGVSMPDVVGVFVGTVQMHADDEELVFHVFDYGEGEQEIH